MLWVEMESRIRVDVRADFSEREKVVGVDGLIGAAVVRMQESD